MRISLMHRAWAATSGTLVVAGAALLATGCSLRHELVAPQTPGVIDEGAASGPTSANGLRIGALGALKLQTGSGETLWHLGGLLADEWKSSSSASATNEIDQRSVSTNNPALTNAYNGIQQARGYFVDAITAMRTYRPYDPAWRGELFLGLAFLDLQMAEDLCNGIPLGSTVDGSPNYSAPLTNAAVFAEALTNLDSALALTTGTDSASVRVRPAALVARARVLVDMGKFSDAAALVSSTAVTTAYQYVLTFSTASGLNGNFNLNNTVRAYTLGDSTDAAGRTANAMPFGSVNDPRVPRTVTTSKGVDGSTTVVTQGQWTSTTAQIPLLSGIDARLVEAEAKLSANDIAGMMTILNALRTTQQTLGTFRPTTQAALATPSSQAAAIALFFREKAFWTFGRGQRLGDLRRMIRQYNGASSAFPTGAFFKGGSYGTDVNLPVPDAERANPNFAGCLDRNA